MATPADKGAVRDVTQIQRRNEPGGLARFSRRRSLSPSRPGRARTVMSTGMRHGYRAALAAILGLQAAILLHLLIGLSAWDGWPLRGSLVLVKFLGVST